MSESDWQPGIFRAVHNYGADSDVALRLHNTQIEFREADFSEADKKPWRDIGCNAQRFFVVRGLWPWCESCGLCEHEILTD